MNLNRPAPPFGNEKPVRPVYRANPGFHRQKHRFTAATSLCVARYAKSCKHLDANTAASFIDHSSGIWNPQARQIANARCPCSREKGEVMKKTLLALCAAATLAVSAVAVPAPAQAQRGVAAGVAAGLIGGAIVGGAIASQNGYYGPGYGYYAPGPAYVAEPGYGPDCFWQCQRFWDGYTWRVRRVRVCD